MNSRFRIRRVGIVAMLLAVTASSAVALAAPASADTATVGVAVSVSPSTVTVGNSVTVTETITNPNGFSILQPSILALSTPDNITGYTTLTGCNAGPGGSCTTTSNSYEAILGAAISGNTSVTVTFTLHVNPNAPSAVETLEGQLIATNFSTNPVPGPTLTINALADLSVSLTGEPEPGGLLPTNLDFAVKVTNNGPGNLVKATYTATATSGLDVQGSSTCAAHNNTATCTIGALPVGGSATAKFTVPIGLLDIGIPFTFSVTRTTSTPTDPNPANDTSSTTCTVVSVLIASCG